MFKGAEREWRFYLADMISFADRVLLYTHKLNQESFVASGLNYDATVRNLELIATRNCLIHGYLGIDNETLWSIIQDDVPALLVALTDLYKNHTQQA